ncbi:helix-turn-helix domain-containing protein [Bacillus suaedae]|uniref:Helix-turn-helix domain-containing protein n=1 Tax=Halalkalibacter suaedae TaxID=2822140 RepID=A0A940X112_9BACI|nr:helix-turn-helix domain-containing protein [Bacillus suaedae]MBP3952569.1 helix-turn-helix domain-containing protein [Bacillus suaedae]
MKKKADMMLHPIRMRIIQTLLTHQRLTVQQLIDELKDVPQATMYRHLKQLTEADLIEVVETNKIRGTIEKIYSVRKENIALSDEDINGTPPEEHLRFFMTYQANLLKEFENYVMNHQPEQYKEDGLGYWQTTFHLSGEEMQEFGEALSTVFQKFSKLEPSPERHARTIASIFIPQKGTEEKK